MTKQYFYYLWVYSINISLDIKALSQMAIPLVANAVAISPQTHYASKGLAVGFTGTISFFSKLVQKIPLKRSQKRFENIFLINNDFTLPKKIKMQKAFFLLWL